MKRHGLLYAGAGFWNLLRLAAGFYVLSSLQVPALSQAEKFLFLWFGSPALVTAGLFFHLYFRPGNPGHLLAMGRLACSLSVANAVFAVVASIVANLAATGFALASYQEVLAVAVIGIGIPVDLLLLLLLRAGDPAVRGEAEAR